MRYGLSPYPLHVAKQALYLHKMCGKRACGMEEKKPSKMEQNRAKIPQKSTIEAFVVGTSRL